MEHSCPDCNEQLEYISDYDRYFCNSCQKYPEKGIKPTNGPGYPPSQGYGQPPRKRSIGASVLLAIGLIFLFLGVGASIVSTDFSSSGDYVGAVEASIVALILIVIAIIFLGIGYGVQHRYKKKMAQSYGPNWAGSSARGSPATQHIPQPDHRARPRPRSSRSYYDEPRRSPTGKRRKDREERDEEQLERPKIPKFCPECGEKTGGTKFCISCGVKLIK
jgi:hypothetical protein